MRQDQKEQSLINVKRQEWRVQIRKKQLQDYFQKRRFALVAEDHRQKSNHMNDEERCRCIIQLISNFSFGQLRDIIAKIMLIDPTLSIFYQLTQFSRESPPPFFKTIIADNITPQNIHMARNNDFYIDKQLTNDEKQSLHEIWSQMVDLWERESQNYVAIICEIKKVENGDLLIREDIMHFLAIILNIMLVFKKMAKWLNIDLSKPTLVGEDTLFKYQISTTLVILHNILACNDQMLAAHLDEFLELVNGVFEFEGLYYNLFLIKHVPSHLKVKMFKYYLRILENNRQYSLQNYTPIITTLYAALSVCPSFTDSNDKYHFIIFSQRLIKFIAELLSIINMRYQTFSYAAIESEDHTFLNQMGWILNYFGSIDSLVGNIIEAKSIQAFVLNHLNYSKVEKQLKVVSYCLSILSNASKNSYSIHYFVNQQPRFIIKIKILFDKFLQTDLKHASVQTMNVLNHLLYLFSGLSHVGKLAIEFIQKQILYKTCMIYFRLNGQTEKQKQMRYSCQILYINLLVCIKENCPSLQKLYEVLFDDRSTYSMLIQMLKYTHTKQDTVNTAITFLYNISINCDQFPQFQRVKQMLLSDIMRSNLSELLDCGNQIIAQRSHEIIKYIERIKYVDHPSQISDHIEDQEMV